VPCRTSVFRFIASRFAVLSFGFANTMSHSHGESNRCELRAQLVPVLVELETTLHPRQPAKRFAGRSC
jgi:hypothetical protein